MSRYHYLLLIRQKHARGGSLGREEGCSLAEARYVELARRYNALYGSGLFDRRLAQFGRAIRDAFKPLLEKLSWR